MISGSDTAKQDIVLVIAGLVALLLFFWLYSDFHPLPAADNSLGKIEAADKAAGVAREFGFDFQFEPVTRFQVDADLLDSLQTQTNFKTFYYDSLNRKLFPAFYWKTDIKMGVETESDGPFFNDESAQTIEIKLSESGKLIELENDDNILPQPVFRPEVLYYGIQEDSLKVYTSTDDSLFIESFEFRFNNNRTNQQGSSNRLQRGQFNFLNETVAQRMAEYYLSQSGWPENDFTAISTERVSIGEKEGALVKFENSIPDISHAVQVDVRILPTGGLVSMEYSHLGVQESEDLFSTIKVGVRAIVLLIGAFWIIVLLFIRFRLRLVDIKAATLVAVLAGMIFPFVIVLENIHSHLSSFGTFNVQFVFMQLIVIGFSAAIATLGFFAVTAISDSITRQYWSEKLRTVDVLRVGYFNNIPIGLAFIRGISCGFILAFLWCLFLYLIPNSYITLETNFESDSTFLPYLSEILGNFLFYFLIAQIVFLIFTGLLHSRYKSAVALVFVPAVLFIVVYPFPLEVGSYTTELVTAGGIGLVLGYIYYREDFLTTFIAMFVFVCMISTANGWLMKNSPDASVFYAFLFLLIVGYIAGGYNIYRGRSVRELPKFVPEYIEELAQEDRIRQELKIARSVQQSFLPANTPEIEGYDIAAVCKPAYETGGDYYDFIRLQDDNVALTIGDVSGKGIQAAFYMTFTKGVLHALCSDYRSSIDILCKANTMFRNNAERGTFISLIFGILNLKSNKFKFSRAGHNPVLYYNSREDKLYEYQPQGIAIGMAGDDVFQKHIAEETIDLEKDDIIILFTDGVVESISKTNKLYGDDRLQNLVKRNYLLSSTELLKKLEDDLDKFGEKSAQHDDLTMIVIKKK